MSYEAIPMKGWCDNKATKRVREDEAKMINLIYDFAVETENRFNLRDVDGLKEIMARMQNMGMSTMDIQKKIEALG